MFVRRTLAALAIGAVLGGATAGVASAGVPENMPDDAYRALQVRSEGLSTLYRDGAPKVAPAPDWVNALVARSEGLNGYQTLPAATPAASPSASTSFAWDDFGIGMAAGLGLVLLAGGLVVAVRAGTRNRVRIPS